MNQLTRWLSLLTCYVLAGAASWATGVALCFVWLWIASGRLTEETFILLWSAIAYVASLLTCHIPCLTALRLWRRGDMTVLPYALLAAMLGAVPTAAIVLFWGGRVRDLWSGATMMFYVLFVPAGALFGLAYAWCHRTFAAPEPRGFTPMLGRSR